MKREQVIEAVQEVVASYSGEGTDLNVDSITAVRILIELESRFEIEFSDDGLSLDEFESIERLVGLVMSYLDRTSICPSVTREDT